MQRVQNVRALSARRKARPGPGLKREPVFAGSVFRCIHRFNSEATPGGVSRPGKYRAAAV
jgi:hypothetical protein